MMRKRFWWNDGSSKESSMEAIFPNCFIWCPEDCSIWSNSPQSDFGQLRAILSVLEWKKDHCEEKGRKGM